MKLYSHYIKIKNIKIKSIRTKSIKIKSIAVLAVCSLFFSVGPERSQALLIPLTNLVF